MKSISDPMPIIRKTDRNDAMVTRPPLLAYVKTAKPQGIELKIK